MTVCPLNSPMFSSRFSGSLSCSHSIFRISQISLQSLDFLDLSNFSTISSSDLPIFPVVSSFVFRLYRSFKFSCIVPRLSGSFKFSCSLSIIRIFQIPAVSRLSESFKFSCRLSENLRISQIFLESLDFPDLSNFLLSFQIPSIDDLTSRRHAG